MRKQALSLTMLAALALPGAAGAALIDRGGGLIYDDVLDITWLQDANYALTSGFAAENQVNNGTAATNNIFADGRMGWDAAVAWANALVFGGFDDWRLPLTPQPDPSCEGQSSDTPSQGFGAGCTGSEMGHLFNVDGITASAPWLFTNVQSSFYWSGSEFALDTSRAWAFAFGPVDSQSLGSKNNTLFAWAVRSGDVGAVASVPEPATTMLLGASLIGFAAARRRARLLGASVH